MDNCEEYNLKEKKFAASEITMLSARSGFGAVICDERIYIVGGNDG